MVGRPSVRLCIALRARLVRPEPEPARVPTPLELRRATVAAIERDVHRRIAAQAQREAA